MVEHWALRAGVSFALDFATVPPSCSGAGRPPGCRGRRGSRNAAARARGRRGVPVPAVEGHARVARVALELLLGIDLGERFGVEDLVFVDAQLADRQAACPRRRSSGRRSGSSRRLPPSRTRWPRPRPRRRRRPATPAPIAVPAAVGVLRRARFLEVSSAR